VIKARANVIRAVKFGLMSKSGSPRCANPDRSL